MIPAPVFKRPATILPMPAEHQRIARARITVWRILNAARAKPSPPREHPGGMFAPRKEAAA